MLKLVCLIDSVYLMISLVQPNKGDYPVLDLQPRYSSNATARLGVVLGLLISALVFITGIEHALLGAVEAAELGKMGFAKSIHVFNLPDNVQNVLTGHNGVKYFLTWNVYSKVLIRVRTWEYDRMITLFTLTNVVHPSRGSRDSKVYVKGNIHLERGSFAAVRKFDINSHWDTRDSHFHFFHANPWLLVQMHRFKLTVSEERQKEGRNSEHAIERDIPESKSFKIRFLGWSLVFTGYACGVLGFLCFYWGRCWRAIVTLIVAGILVHAGLSFLLYERWIFS